MSKEFRQNIAKHTLSICANGFYNLEGKVIKVEASTRKGKLYSETDWPKLAPPSSQKSTIQFANESTVTGIHAEHGSGRVAALNFASARQPGGGFINGAVAQEEALCYASNLYLHLLDFPEFYRKHSDAKYSDDLIYTPDVVFFRDADFELCQPSISDIITIAAPNAAALNTTDGLEEIFLRRIHKICDVAIENNVSTLIIGAWGCGVFKNDPFIVAKCFASVLPKFSIKKVRFSILGEQINIFYEVLANET